MIFFRLLLIIFFCNICFSSNEELKDYYINQTNQQFNSINDYKVDMIIRLEIPAFRMPKKKYKVFYKQPDKIKRRNISILIKK